MNVIHLLCFLLKDKIQDFLMGPFMPDTRRTMMFAIKRSYRTYTSRCMVWAIPY